MKKKFWFSSFLDILGLLALGGAFTALAGALWFTHYMPEATLFTIFHICLAVALGSFLINRLVEIARVVSKAPHPKLMRAASATPTVPVTNLELSNVTEGKFRRAA